MRVIGFIIRLRTISARPSRLCELSRRFKILRAKSGISLLHPALYFSAHLRIIRQLCIDRDQLRCNLGLTTVQVEADIDYVNAAGIGIGFKYGREAPTPKLQFSCSWPPSNRSISGTA